MKMRLRLLCITVFFLELHNNWGWLGGWHCIILFLQNILGCAEKGNFTRCFFPNTVFIIRYFLWLSMSAFFLQYNPSPYFNKTGFKHTSIFCFAYVTLVDKYAENGRSDICRKSLFLPELQVLSVSVVLFTSNLLILTVFKHTYA